MGQIASGFQLESEQNQLPDHLVPARSDWITAHAIITKLAIVEIERLWERFQQLGCNANGELTAAAVHKHSISEDIFAKNILATLKSPNGNVKFLTFLNCMKWAELATREDKIRAVFQLLNNGDPISRDLITKLMKRLYPDEDQRRYDQLTDITMTQLGGRRNGIIKEEQFLERVKSIPAATTAKLFSFLIVPNELNEEARQAFSSFSKYPGPSTGPQSRASTKPPSPLAKTPRQSRASLNTGTPGAAKPHDLHSKVTTPNSKVTTPKGTNSPATQSRQSTGRKPPPVWAEDNESNHGRTDSTERRIPTDAVLLRIANKIHKRDWHILANRLGFTAADIGQFERNTTNTEDQVFTMLKGWRQKEGSAATCHVLEDKLQQCEMADAGTLLYP